MPAAGTPWFENRRHHTYLVWIPVPRVARRTGFAGMVRSVVGTTGLAGATGTAGVMRAVCFRSYAWDGCRQPPADPLPKPGSVILAGSRRSSNSESLNEVNSRATSRTVRPDLNASLEISAAAS